jgi:hypothetical protein
MIAQTSGLEKTFKCTAAIATAFTIAKFGADDDTLSIASTSDVTLVGVFQHTTDAAGDDVNVMMTGISNIKLGGTVTRGDRLTSDSNGNAIKATDSDQTSIAYAMASGVVSDIIPCLLTLYSVL